MDKKLCYLRHATLSRGRKENRLGNCWLKESEQRALLKLERALVSRRFGFDPKFALSYLTLNILSGLWLSVCGRLDNSLLRCPCVNPQNLGICYLLWQERPCRCDLVKHMERGKIILDYLVGLM